MSMLLPLLLPLFFAFCCTQYYQFAENYKEYDEEEDREEERRSLERVDSNGSSGSNDSNDSIGSNDSNGSNNGSNDSNNSNNSIGSNGRNGSGESNDSGGSGGSGERDDGGEIEGVMLSGSDEEVDEDWTAAMSTIDPEKFEEARQGVVAMLRAAGVGGLQALRRLRGRRDRGRDGTFPSRRLRPNGALVNALLAC